VIANRSFAFERVWGLAAAACRFPEGDVLITFLHEWNDEMVGRRIGDIVLNESYSDSSSRMICASSSRMTPSPGEWRTLRL
jgi:hypothetical protein